MESVLAAFIVIFLVIFSVLTFSDALLSTQDELGESWREMEMRLADYQQVSIAPVDSWLTADETLVALVLANTGTDHLANYRDWDVILQYYDDADPAVYHIEWLSYTTANPPGPGQWTVDAIYQDAATAAAEVYEPGILNPGEELVLYVKAVPPVGIGQALQARVVTASGKGASIAFTRNHPPELTINTPLEMWHSVTDTLTADHLTVSDVDNTPDDLLYTVTVPPAQGTLSAETFTQADLDAELVTYTHTGTGDDSFQFMVADGTDEISGFTFEITTRNAPPVLAANTGMAIALTDTGVIAAVALAVSDANTPPESIVYTVTVQPVKGALSLSPTFTQADINQGNLTYSHTQPGLDSFTFTVTDGEESIGPYVFGITMP
jgi:hypothetical protein